MRRKHGEECLGVNRRLGNGSILNFWTLALLERELYHCPPSNATYDERLQSDLSAPASQSRDGRFG
jgi:hypothetical protein